MSDHEQRLLLALGNFIVCSALGWICLCRIHAMQASTTRRSSRIQYVLLMVAVSASGFSPVLFGQWPTVVQTALTAAFVLVLAGGSIDWKDGLPSHVQSGPVPLDEAT